VTAAVTHEIRRTRFGEADELDWGVFPGKRGEWVELETQAMRARVLQLLRGMRPLASAAALLAVTLHLRTATAAPTATEPEGRAGPEARPSGAFVAVELKTTTITSELGALVGGQGGWLIGHRFALGLAGYGLASTHSAPRALEQGGTPAMVSMGYGGLRLAYVLMPYAPVHGVFGALVGGGRAAVTSNDVGIASFDTHHAVAFFTVEPLAELEVNVDENFRVALAGSWRYLSRTGLPGLSSSDLSGPAGSLVLRYGRF
jgi:hypothetical protein